VVVAEAREILVVSKQTAQKFDGGKI